GVSLFVPRSARVRSSGLRPEPFRGARDARIPQGPSLGPTLRPLSPGRSPRSARGLAERREPLSAWREVNAQGQRRDPTRAAGRLDSSSAPCLQRPFLGTLASSPA